MVRRLFLVVLATAFALTVDAAKLGRREPSGIHLAFGNEDDEMVVGRMTLEETKPVVEYQHVSPSARVRRAVGASRVFVDGGPERLVRHLHFVTLRGLEPGARYAYRVGDGSPEKMDSPPSLLRSFRFRSEPEPIRRRAATRARDGARVSSSAPSAPASRLPPDHP